MNSLLQKAKQNPSNKQEITAEHIELAEAFVRNEVGITSVNKALGHPKTSIQGYITICRALRKAYSLKQ